MNLNNDLKPKGSKTAKDGYKNEYFIIEKFGSMAKMSINI